MASRNSALSMRINRKKIIFMFIINWFSLYYQSNMLARGGKGETLTEGVDR